MYELIAAFKSRSQAMSCFAALKAECVPAGVIPLPEEARAGCGLGVKTPYKYADTLKDAVLRGRYSSFYGFIKMEIKGGIYRFK